MFNAAIAAMCAGAVSTSQGNYQEACNKGFEAVSISYGIDKHEKELTKKAENIARKHVSNEVAMGATAIYTLAIAREARISTKDVPFVQSTSLILRFNSAELTFSWSF